MPILNSINQMQDEKKDWRQDLHKIPEIGLEEYETSNYIKNKLKLWNIDFKEKRLQVRKNNRGKINLYEGIAAFDLLKLIKGTTSWDNVGISGNYRTFSNIYRVGTGTFEFFPLDRPFPLPLLQTFPNNQEMDRKKYMKDVLRWKERA